MRQGFGRVAGFLGLCAALWLGGKLLLPLCFPFLLGTALALLAEPLVSRLCRRVHLNRTLAAGLGVSGVFALVFLALGLLLTLAVRQLGAWAGRIPELAETAVSGLRLLQGRLLDMADRMPQSLRPVLRQNVTGLFSGSTALVGKLGHYGLDLAGGILSRVPDSALNLGTAVLSGFMISAKLPRIRREITARISRERLEPMAQTVKAVKEALAGWLLAQLRLTGVTLGILTAGLLLLRIPGALLLALGICLVDALPVLGTGTILLPWAAVCLLQGDKARALGLAGTYAVITLVRSALEPRLVGKQLGLDPLVTLFFLYAGYKLWGIAGMLLSPLAAVAVVRLLPVEK